MHALRWRPRSTGGRARAAALALLVVSELCARAEEKMSPLETTLAVNGAQSVTRGVQLQLTVTNRSKTTQRFCRYHTPFEGVRNHFLEIIDSSGKLLSYRGIMAKRAPPTDKDFESLAPGASKSATFALRDAYEVGAGRYTLRFLGGAVSGLPDSAPIPIVIAP